LVDIMHWMQTKVRTFVLTFSHRQTSVRSFVHRRLCAFLRTDVRTNSETVAAQHFTDDITRSVGDANKIKHLQQCRCFFMSFSACLDISILSFKEGKTGCKRVIAPTCQLHRYNQFGIDALQVTAGASVLTHLLIGQCTLVADRVQ